MQQAPLVHYKTFVYDSSRWEGFRFRPGDIVISTPPKCGTTWTQQILAMLVLQKPELERPLSRLSPWVDMLTRSREQIFAELDAQTHRRFIKSHTPLDGIPYDERVTYICVGRDPRDVAISWDGHMANADMAALFAARDAAVGNDDIKEMIEQGPPPMPATLRERFWEWVASEASPTEFPSSLQATLHHLQSFWDARSTHPNIVMLHYDDLRADLEGQMRALAARLSIDVPESLWPALVRAATFEEMRSNADKTAPNSSESIWQDNKQFFKSGTSGQWRELFEEGDLARYEARVRQLSTPDLATWAHHGTLSG
jgi:aryl sulfotransferase